MDTGLHGKGIWTRSIIGSRELVVLYMSKDDTRFDRKPCLKELTDDSNSSHISSAGSSERLQISSTGGH